MIVSGASPSGRRPRFLGANERTKSEQVPGNRSLQAALLLLVAVATVSQVLQVASARYVHPTYKFRSSPMLGEGAGVDEDYDQQQVERARLARRQDFESDNDDDGDDQNAAASYQNQDDGNGGGGGAGGAADGYDDTEPDGPYEETPVEKEGQADLERFFDDHLGASDRDGMDKENLPSNLVALLSEPPTPSRLADHHQASPTVMAGEQQARGAAPVVGATPITVMPMASVTNPRVRPIKSDAAAALARPDPLQMVETIQETSFIRLPDEKMIVTHQVTARSRPAAPLKFGLRAGGNDNDVNDDDDDEERGDAVAGREHRARAHGKRPPPLLLLPLRRRAPQAVGHAATTRSDGLALPRDGIPLSAHPGAASSPQPQGPRVVPDALAARSSEVVATEDEDDDRVYVTNATDKPFKIDALGGYDPEEDFIDAAKDLEVVAAGDGRPGRHSSDAGHRRQAPLGPPPKAHTRVRPGRPVDDDQFAWAASNDDRSHQALGGPDISFHVPDTEHLYGDASETDEVTFGQDDPYQTDLEAEMRQQEFDKISSFNRREPEASEAASEGTGRRSSPESSGSSNVAVDKGEPVAQLDEDESEADADNDDKSEPKVEQTEARARATERPKDEIDDEGSWINDGVDEMDIPSQSHQNSVLEKAARREEAAKKVAKAAEQQPTNDDEENQRMPNADYLKNDLVEDDSGYARAA